MTDLDKYSVRWTLAVPPQPVGYWVMYPQASIKTMFVVYHRPTDEQIANTERLLGWGWKEAA